MLESEVQRLVTIVFRAAGGVVYDLSQGVRGKKEPGGKWNAQGGTRQTPGLPDLRVFFPRLGICGDFEVKTPEGERLHQKMLSAPAGTIKAYQLKNYQRAMAQDQYEQHCKSCHHPYARGGAAEAAAWLRSLGIIPGSTL